MKRAAAGAAAMVAPPSGPRIGPNPLPVAAFIKYVRAPTNQMPPYTAKVMSNQELTDVRAFLAARPKPAAAAVLAPEARHDASSQSRSESSRFSRVACLG